MTIRGLHCDVGLRVRVLMLEGDDDAKLQLQPPKNDPTASNRGKRPGADPKP